MLHKIASFDFSCTKPKFGPSQDPFYYLTIYLSTGTLFIPKSIKSKSIPQLPPQVTIYLRLYLTYFSKPDPFFFHPEAMYMYLIFFTATIFYQSTI